LIVSNWWVTTELDEFGGFQRDWYGPFPSEGEAEKVALPLSKQGKELVAETVFGIAGRDGTRFAEFVRGRRYTSGASGWFTVKPSPKVKIPSSANGHYPAS
jgi:hypothetical protein